MVRRSTSARAAATAAPDESSGSVGDLGAGEGAGWAVTGVQMDAKQRAHRTARTSTATRRGRARDGGRPAPGSPGSVGAAGPGGGGEGGGEGSPTRKEEEARRGEEAGAPLREGAGEGSAPPCPGTGEGTLRYSSCSSSPASTRKGLAHARAEHATGGEL